MNYTGSGRAELKPKQIYLKKKKKIGIHNERKIPVLKSGVNWEFGNQVKLSM